MGTPITTAGLVTLFGPLAANTPLKVPASSVSGRVFFRIWNFGNTPIYYGYSSGLQILPIGPNDHSPIIPSSANVWVMSTDGSQEGATEELS